MTLAQNTQWLIGRLQTMGPMEIFSRLGEMSRHAALRASLKAVQRRAHRHPTGLNHLLWIPERDGCLAEIHQGMRHRVVALAMHWLHHRASFFALHEVPLGDSIDWHRDYSCGVRSPLGYSTSINHRDVAVVGNLKYVWELNRLQHLVLLALAAIWTGHAGYQEEIARQLLSWRAQNPFMRGVNWKSPLEAGLRLITWALLAFLTRGFQPLEDLFSHGLKETIYQHQYFIRKFFSKHSSANNHLVGEMAGLYIASVFWPRYQESSVWQSFARQKLIEEINRQVEPDGVGKERATEYQLFILEFFLLAGALGQAIGDPFPQEYWDRLARMLSFLTAIADGQGNLPLFGDGDSGQVVWLPETTSERARTLSRLAEPGSGSGADVDLRTALLLWGQPRQAIPLEQLPPPHKSLQAFTPGGYYVLAADRGGDDEMLVVFDAGPLGLGPLYAHGHADALSFWLSYGGHEFLVDPGTYCYYAKAQWRAHFRGTAAHNTVRVDGQDQSVAGGPFLWRHVAHSHVEHLEDNTAFVAVEGVHDGYRRLADPVIHRRGMRLCKRSRTLVVSDRLECRGTHAVEVLFHFSEKSHIRPTGPHSFQISNGLKQLNLRLDSRLQSTLYRGSENPPYGWVSRTFDAKEPTFTLVARATVTGSTQFLTEIAAL